MTGADSRSSEPSGEESDVVDELLATYYRRDAGPPRWPDPRADDFGAYRLLEPLGQGGMGHVFLAEQSQPVQRRVALKILRTNLDSQTLLLRFRAERQALARMNHDHIARVFDAGESRSGRPFFVMEYVPGPPFTAYCEQHRLDLDARLRLFAAICDGVQHAHDNGVLHRDLKPGNVLVVQQGERPVPKIIDFGLARLLDESAEHRAGYSRHGSVLGTPDYMSPEQASGRADLGPQTDVYSLGVILYELLTGARPFAADGKARSEEAPMPSSRLVAAGPAIVTIAEQRRTEPSRLLRRVRGDLDWIVVRALQEDAGRRYPSAAALAADVRAYLEARPVSAKAASVRDRLRRWARRHPALAGGLVGGVTIGACALAVSIAWRAFVPTARAEAEATTSSSSDEQLLGSRRLVADTVSELVDPDRLTSMPSAAQRALLQLALDVNRKRIAEAQGNRAVAAEVAVAQVEIGRALEQLGRADEAAAALHTAHSMLEELLASSPERLDLRGQRGRALDALARLARDRGDGAVAIDRARAAVDDLRAAATGTVGGAFDGASSSALGGLVDALYDAGKYAEALAASDEQIAVLRRIERASRAAPPALDEVLRAHYSRGLARNGMGQFAGARDALAEAVELAEQRAKERALTRDERWLLASTRRLLARLLQRLAGNRDEGPAGAMARQALADFRALAREFGDAPDDLHGAGSSLFLLAEFRRHAEDHTAAKPLYDDGLQLVLQALEAAPTNRRFVATAAAFLRFGSSSRFQLGEYQETADAVLRVQARWPVLTFTAAQVLAELAGILAKRPNESERGAAEAAAVKAVELLSSWAVGRADAERSLIWADGLDPLRQRADFNALTKDPTGRADDRESIAPVDASWCVGQTAEQLARQQTDGWRIVDLALESLEPPRFAAAFVRNEGAFRRQTHWLPESSANDLRNFAQSATPIVAAAATVHSGSEWRAALVLGEASPTGWIWRPSVSTAEVRALAHKHRARPISVSTTLDATPARLSVVFTGNHQWDFREWRIEKTDPATIVRDHAAGWAVTDLVRLADDSLRCISVRATVPGQQLGFGWDADEVQERLTALGCRVVAFCTYERGGRRLYDVVLNPNARR